VSAYYADSLINRAKRDSFVIRADAIEIREAPKPTKVQIQTSEIPIAVNVEIKVYDVLGREVATLINETLQPGKYKVRWNGTDRNGALVSSGVYFYVMKAGKFIQTRKMMLLK
jgi:flagellar hook assembly protein FlgD